MDGPRKEKVQPLQPSPRYIVHLTAPTRILFKIVPMYFAGSHHRPGGEVLKSSSVSCSGWAEAAAAGGGGAALRLVL